MIAVAVAVAVAVATFYRVPMAGATEVNTMARLLERFLVSAGLAMAAWSPSASAQVDVERARTVLRPQEPSPARVRTVTFAGANGAPLRADVYHDPTVRELRPGIVFVSGTEDARGWSGYRDFARLAVERGFVAIIPEKRFPRGGSGIADGRDDTLALFRAAIATDLIDHRRVCFWAFSGGGSTMSVVYRPDAPRLRCAVGFYPILSLRAFAPDDPGWLAEYSPTDVAAVSGGPDSPATLILRAGLDSETINGSIDAFAATASRRNMPVHVTNLPHARHAFDLVDDADGSREAIQEAFRFTAKHTGLERPPRNREQLTRELVALEQERQAAYVAGDRAVLERHFAREYTHTNLRGGTTDRDAELAFYAPGTFSLESGSISDVVVHDYGTTAVLLGLVAWRGATYRAPTGPPIDLSGRFRVTRTYVWRDGRWQLAASHASRVPESAR